MSNGETQKNRSVMSQENSREREREREGFDLI